MDVSPRAVSSFKVARTFSLPEARTLRYSPDGEALAVFSSDGALHTFDCLAGIHCNVFNMRKHPVAAFEFLFPNSIIHSTSVDAHLRYLSLHDNTYVRIFEGHASPPQTIAVSPLNDTVLSAATDDLIYMWDIKQSSPVASILSKGAPVVSFSPDGLVFAVFLEGGNVMKLFDARAYSTGPYFTKTTGLLQGGLSSVEFSPDGHTCLLACAKSLFVVDAFTGEVLCAIPREAPESPACFAPDPSCILYTSGDGSISCGVRTGQGFKKMDPLHSNSLPQEKGGAKAGISQLRFNPVYAQFVSLAGDLAIWHPPVMEAEVEAEFPPK